MINVKNPNYSHTPASKARPLYPYRSSEDSPPVTVSILTPFYNTDDVFLETAQSIFSQSFQEWEWVIVDDGSTDAASIERLVAVEQRDARVRVIRQPNSGPAAARNAAFRNSSGRYICLLDSDDLLEPTFIEKTVWFLESQPDFAFCNSWSVNFGDRNFLWTRGYEFGKQHLKENSGPPISLLRREAFQAVGGFDETIKFGHEDWAFWLSLANAGFWGHTLTEYLEWYRIRRSGRFSQVMSTSSTHDDFTAIIRKKYAGLETRFPNPQLREHKPYAAIETAFPFKNQLFKAPGEHRILFLIPWMVTGGADKVNLDWIKGLIDNGYKVSICATLQSANDWYHEFARLTPDIFVLHNFLRLTDFPRFIVYLIQSRQIDTVLINASTIGYQLLPYLRANCSEVAFVDLCHVEEPHWLSGGHPRFGVGYQDVLDVNIVTTNILKNWMISKGADATRIEVVYTGVDLVGIDAVAEQRNALRVSLGLPAELPVIVFAGRICEQKRPQLFAKILRELASRGINFRCLVIGDGDLRPLLEKLIKDYSLKSSVSMLGIVDHQRWLEILAASDIFLLPSEYEGISVALFEALAMRHVVPVMSDVGGQAEVITPGCGFLVPKGDNEVNEYADILSFLINNPDKRTEIAEAGNARILDKFSSEKGVTQLMTVLDKAVNLAHTHPRLPLTVGLAREMASFAIEYTRLTSASNVLWDHWSRTSGDMGAQVPPSMVGVYKLLDHFEKSRIGNAMLRNRLLLAMGRWLTEKLEK